MNDQTTAVAELKARMAAFIKERAWEKYHQPKNLAMSVAIEAGELMERFQWLTADEARAALADEAFRQEVADEMADVLAFLLSLANATGIDLAASFEAKLAKNRVKYPVEQVKGHYKRPEQT